MTGFGIQPAKHSETSPSGRAAFLSGRKAWYGKISSLRAQRVSQELKQNTRLRNSLVTSVLNKV